MTHAVLYSVEGHIASLTLNRPERRNALDNAMYLELVRRMQEAASDDDVRVLVLSGAQGYFTAGNDLGEFIGIDPGEEFIPLRFLRTIACFPKPVVAAVEGGAIGVGTTMLLHCDFAYAGRSTRFLMPFIDLGVCPEGGSSVLLAPLAGDRAAARWLMLGESFTTDEAERAGLITQATDDGAAAASALATARKLATFAPEAVCATKALLTRTKRAAVLEAIDIEGKAFVELLTAPTAQSALKNLLARRQHRSDAQPARNT